MLELWQLKHRKIIVAVVFALTTIVTCVSVAVSASEIYRKMDHFAPIYGIADSCVP